MQRTRIAAFVALLLLASQAVIAQEELLDEPRSLEQITFNPPTSASIRLTNGVRRTGKIVSISRESMVYQVGRDNKEVTVEIDDIDRVNTLDNEFTYEPEDEDFERLKIKARRIGFLTVQTVQTYVPPPEGVSPSVPPAVVDPVTVIPDPVVPPAVTTEPPPVVNVSPTVTSPTTADPTVEIPDDEPQPGQLILFCSNCQGRLPLSIKNGEPCPHCGTPLINNTAGGTPSRTTGGHGAARNSNTGNAAYPEVTGTPAAVGGNGGAVPAGDANGGGQVSARGFELSQVPVWMQIGFFVGLLAIGWLLLQRR